MFEHASKMTFMFMHTELILLVMLNTEKKNSVHNKISIFFRVFTNIYSLPIEKDGHACRNISI